MNLPAYEYGLMLAAVVLSALLLVFTIGPGVAAVFSK